MNYVIVLERIVTVGIYNSIHRQQSAHYNIHRDTDKYRHIRTSFEITLVSHYFLYLNISLIKVAA